MEFGCASALPAAGMARLFADFFDDAKWSNKAAPPGAAFPFSFLP
jgi:hypothetical protein